ncbi:MAG: membrane dipeptidase [Candidatus Hydrogenedentes bacterium]|nr:membrane dipeptidase [Candidatus Hydrogenedentota bacterium]
MSNTGVADGLEDKSGNKPVTRRRFLGCAAVGGAAVIGSVGVGAGIDESLKRSNESTQATENQEALKRLLLRSQEGPSGKRFPVLDLHSHPSLKAYMFRQRFWKTHKASPGVSPTSLVVDVDALVNGGTGAFLCTAYALEREFFSDVIPLRVLSMLHPRPHRMATAPMNVLAMEHLDKAEAMVAETNRRRGDIVALAKSYSDMKRIVGEGRVCMLHAMEGAHHLAGKTELVDDFFNRGVCMMTVPHLYPNEAGGCVDLLTAYRKHSWARRSFSDKYQDSSGLSPWGHELVEKLLDVGIVVDMVHGTMEYRRQIIGIAKKHPKRRPITISHIGIEKNPEAGMGPSPEDVRAIADTGGVVGLMMVHHGHGASQDPVEAMLHAVEYLVKHGGEDVVAIGSDFDGYAETPKGLASPRDFGAVRTALLAKYTEEQTAKFLFGNGDRLLRMGWGKA